MLFQRQRQANVSIKRNLPVLSGLFLAALVFGALYASNANAQTAKNASSAKAAADPIAPIAQFINENTLFVSYVNVEQINFNKLEASLGEVFKQFTVNVGFKDDPLERINEEFKVTAKALREDLEKAAAENLKETGYSNFYTVVQSAKGDGACIIIPAQSMTEAQIDKIKESFSNGQGLNCALYQKKFLIASSTPLKEIGAYYRNFKPKRNPKIEAFFKANSDKLGAFYSGRIKIREMYKNLVPQAESEEEASLGVPEQSLRSTGKERVAQMQEEQKKASFLQGGVFGKTTRNRKVDDPFENSPRCVKDAIETFDSSLVEMNGYIDASTLSLRATLKFSSPANAARFKDAYVKIYGEVIPSGVENVQLLLDLLAAQYETKEEMAADNHALYTVVTFKMLPVLREFLCGEAICHQPRQSDSEIVLEESVLAEVKKLGPNTIGFASFVGALFVPEAEMFLAPEQSGSATPSSPSSPKPARPRATSSNGSYAPEEGDLDSVFEEEDAASDGQEKGDGGNPFKEVEPSEGADSSDSNGENPFKEVESSEGADSGDDNPFKEVDG